MEPDKTRPVARLNPTDIQIDCAPIVPASVRFGTPCSGWSSIPAPPGIEMGVWEHTAGTSIDVEGDEAFVVLSGRATVVLDDGRSYDFGPGDVGVLRAEARTTWIVHETFRKVFIVLSTDDD